MNHAPVTGPLILLVENDDDIADATGQLLQSEGYRVHRVPGSVEAGLYFAELERAGEKPPDLVLLDDLMHEARVLDLLNTLDAQGYTNQSIVLFSAWPASRLERLARRIRAVGVVVKPFDVARLLMVVKTAVGLGSDRDSRDTDTLF
ncbi:MAG: response regulator [Chloroflexia bacterium]